MSIVLELFGEYPKKIGKKTVYFSVTDFSEDLLKKINKTIHYHKAFLNEASSMMDTYRSLELFCRDYYEEIRINTKTGYVARSIYNEGNLNCCSNTIKSRAYEPNKFICFCPDCPLGQRAIAANSIPRWVEKARPLFYTPCVYAVKRKIPESLSLGHIVAYDNHPTKMAKSWLSAFIAFLEDWQTDVRDWLKRKELNKKF